MWIYPTAKIHPVSLLIAAAAVASVVACSAAQKNAERNLLENSGKCVLEKLDLSFEDAAKQCGINALTDPQTYRDLLILFTSARTGAERRASVYITDAGAPCCAALPAKDGGK